MWVGIAGIIGVVIGGLLQIVANIVIHKIQTKKTDELDLKRKQMLRKMLDNVGTDGWRTMKTMSGVIGADREETARLLIEIDARASESGNDSWAYIKNKPLK